MTTNTRGDWDYFSVGRGHSHHRPLLLRVRRTLSRQPHRTRFPCRPAGKRGPPAPSRTHRHHAPSRSHPLRRKRWPVAVQPCRNMTPGVRGGCMHSFQDFAGSFQGFVEAFQRRYDNDGTALQLAQMVTDTFPSFRDEHWFEGRRSQYNRLSSLSFLTFMRAHTQSSSGNAHKSWSPRHGQPSPRPPTPIHTRSSHTASAN